MRSPVKLSPAKVPECYEDSYRPCYVRGSEGIIIELAEQIS